MNDAPRNPHLPLLERNLPRLLALFDLDETSPTFGCGDRRYWAWKLIDFPNATYQGAAYGLALLFKAGLLPSWLPKQACLHRIGAMIDALPAVTDKKGGLAEALPNEGSFCVTGLVLSDLCGALLLLKQDMPSEDWWRRVELCQPLAAFLKKQDERHGLISNHLAVAALGMLRWHALTHDEEARGRAMMWIARIKENECAEEGWLSEYGGADPGYQSWGCSSLAEIHRLAPAAELLPLLARGYGFLSHFAMPDGSFANGCGCRLTRFLFAGGAEIMASEAPGAAALASFARRYAASRRYVNLDSVDEPNLVPLFNDTALAAVHWKEAAEAKQSWETAEIHSVKHFEKAGILIHYGPAFVSIVALHRGGFFVRVARDGTARRETAEPHGLDAKGTVFCAREALVTKLEGSNLELEAGLYAAPRMLPSPFKFLVLRLLSLTVFRSLTLGNAVKKLLAHLLLTPSDRATGRVMRRIDWATGETTDEVRGAKITLRGGNPHFSPRHMASQGYWQISDGAAP